MLYPLPKCNSSAKSKATNAHRVTHSAAVHTRHRRNVRTRFPGRTAAASTVWICVSPRVWGTGGKCTTRSTAASSRLTPRLL